MNTINKLKALIARHKMLSITFILILIGGLYYIRSKSTNTSAEIRYVLGSVKKDTIVSSINGTGQVSALNQIDIKSTVSGKITYVGVEPGKNVGNGKILFNIDNTEAQKAVRDASISLKSAQIDLSKTQIQNSDINLNTNLAKAYDDGFSTVLNTFLDLPGVMSGFNNTFFQSTIIKNGQINVDWYESQVNAIDKDDVKEYKKRFTDSYDLALKAYNTTFSNYQKVSRTSDNKTLEDLIGETYNTLKLISSAIKNANNYIDFVNTSIEKTNNNPPAIIATHQASLNQYTSKTNTDLQNLLSIENEIQSNKDAFNSNDLNTESLKLSITQKENTLKDTQDNLKNYSITAPFDGIIASVPVQKNENINTGTVLCTIITNKQTGIISLNEVDVAKVKLGDKASITFDAIPKLSITGKVSEIDPVGIVSQGVVNYNVKISFDTNNPNVKTGMSLSANIITDTKENILIVPNTARKQQKRGSYVEMFDAPLSNPPQGVQGSVSSTPPRQQPITTGISNNFSTEIISGLNEGDKIVIRKITPTTGTTSTSAPSILGSSTGRGFGGSATRTSTPTR